MGDGPNEWAIVAACLVAITMLVIGGALEVIFMA